METMYVTNTEPTNLVIPRGRNKSPFRLALENLEVGQWLRRGQFTEDGEMGKVTNSTRQTVHQVGRAENRKFSVRKTDNSELWVGRVS